MFVLGTSICDGGIAVLAEKILHLVALRCQEVKQFFQTICHGKHLVVCLMRRSHRLIHRLLYALYLIPVEIAPELAFQVASLLELLSCSINELFSKNLHLSVVWCKEVLVFLVLQQVGDLVDDSVRHIIVRL